ncbi:hypothetical protein GPALN_012513 [Globodera pallida]|nr:hypothetical protein GPALN_012513 [Globodera pallida]
MNFQFSTLPQFVFAFLLLNFSMRATHGQRSIRVRYPWKALNDGHGSRSMHVQQVPSMPTRQTARRDSERQNQPLGKDPMPNAKLNRRKLVSVRYQSVFGNSEPLRGSEYVPTNIELYTGKLATSRREKFNWAPRGNIYLFPRH